MSKMTDDSFLFQSMFRTPKKRAIGSFQLSRLNIGSVQAQLRAERIDTNSAQYRAVIKEMMQNGNGVIRFVLEEGRGMIWERERAAYLL